MNGIISSNPQNKLKVFEEYLRKHAVRDRLIDDKPSGNLFLSVVIPCYAEPDALRSLESLRACSETTFPVEILVVVNHSESADSEIKQQNAKTYSALSDWSLLNSDYLRRFYVIPAFNLSDRDAGVGMARKIGMDEAVRRFLMCGNEKGVIAGFDADCTCSENYLAAIEKTFMSNHINAASLYFEHSLKGNEHNESVYRCAEQYEMHLRYYKNALVYTGFPFSYHTVGSSFAVRAGVYCCQGGMNKRKAGEDFYFLSKVIPLGGYCEINNTCVFPSPRPSERVPFGTGAAVKKMLDANRDEFLTYPFSLFVMLQSFFSGVTGMYNESHITFPDNILGHYCKKNQEVIDLEQVKKNTASAATFTKRFYTVFNAFRILKFLNYAIENGYELKPVSRESKELLETKGYAVNQTDILELLRTIDRNGY